MPLLSTITSNAFGAAVSRLTRTLRHRRHDVRGDWLGGCGGRGVDRCGGGQLYGGAVMAALCDNCGCPAAVSCAHHFGRSRSYGNAMAVTHTEARAVEPGQDHCDEYVADRARPWLLSPADTRRLMDAVLLVKSLPLGMR